MPTDNKSSKQLTQKIAGLASDKKAEKIVSIDLSGITSIADHFVICSADTEIQIKAIADNIRKNTPHKPLRIEGYEKMNWIILDYVDVVVHVFKTFEKRLLQPRKTLGRRRNNYL